MTSRRYRWSMWSDACELLAQAERIHGTFFDLVYADSMPMWEPPVNIFELGRTLIVWVALPGIDPEQTEIELRGRLLRIAGICSIRCEPRRATVRRLEIPHGRLERVIELPNQDYEVESRDSLNGCLRLELRRSNP